MEKNRRVTLLAALCAVLCLAAGAIEIPKASGPALGVTRGKQFDAGIVFINGRFIEPPYVVERWGVGIRINGVPAVPQVVDWMEFLKTQPGFKAVRTASLTLEPMRYGAPAASDDADTSLDDLFDDDPKPQKPSKPAAAPKPAEPARPARPKKPASQVSYSFDGPFTHNNTTRTYVTRINALRTEIDKTLRSGGFICFGDGYARVSGDQRAAMQLLERLPEIMRRSETLDAFKGAVRAANLVYLTDAVCADLFRCRIDYRKLQDRRKKIKEDQELKKLMKGISTPLF